MTEPNETNGGILMFGNTLGLPSPLPANFVFHGPEREIFRITQTDGKWDVVLADGVAWTDAARTFWDAVETMTRARMAP